MSEKISLVIVEDNELMLLGISSALEEFEALDIIGTANNGLAGLELVRRVKPNIALVDIKMPKMSGIELTKAIRDEELPTNIVVLTSLEDDEWVYKAFLNGANAYTLKDIQPSELFQTIKMVASGLTLIQPAIAKNILSGLQKKDQETVQKDEKKQSSPLTESLTERELEILKLIAKGYKNKQIAETACITEGTVKLHINNILRKLGVQDRTQALIKAMENDLID